MFNRWAILASDLVVLAHSSLAKRNLPESPFYLGAADAGTFSGETDSSRFELPLTVVGIERGNRESKRSTTALKLLVFDI